MTIAGELEFGFFCGNFSQNQNLIWNHPAESHQMGISHFFYRVFTNRELCGFDVFEKSLKNAFIFIFITKIKEKEENI